MFGAFDRQKWYYKRHKKELLKKYLGKYLVIYKSKVQGAFSSFSEAVDFMKDKPAFFNKFIIKQVLEKEPVYVNASIYEVSEV